MERGGWVVVNDGISSKDSGSWDLVEEIDGWLRQASFGNEGVGPMSEHDAGKGVYQR